MHNFVGEQIVVIVFEDGHYLSGDSLLKVKFEQELIQNSDEKTMVYNVKLKESKYLNVDEIKFSLLNYTFCFRCINKLRNVSASLLEISAIL